MTSDEGYENCRCCAAGEYAGDETAEDVSCPACGHAPEEHMMMVIYPANLHPLRARALAAVDRFLGEPDVALLPMRKVA